MKLNEKIKQLRIDNNMTQKELAKKLGVSTVSLQRYEYGRFRISYENILKILEIFDISLNDFINDLDTEEKDSIERNKLLDEGNKFISKIYNRISFLDEYHEFEEYYLNYDKDVPDFNKRQNFFSKYKEICYFLFKCGFVLEIEPHDDNIKILNKTLKISYVTKLEKFENYIIFLSDDFINHFITFFQLNFFNEFEENTPKTEKETD